ncbi:glycosyltransferase family 2 protein [Parabacteroides sp. PF5-9]|uniref:glycosyltransferase family 2 protein n=1 Tax=Parabacteroides sp. PF5-9 TaxID=1742404 RepID=UPI0024741AEE|nr:glycosyltransferase family 2 protein [Parabacteroides sp. PF5-9]MDH6358879.1 GT2 family glycosyltransferase [Parabacteroides sp. PF5-9]
MLSIVILTWNSERYLRNCLEAVIASTVDLSDYEIIIVDNGSTDATLQLIHLYQDKMDSLILLQNQVNLGVAKARNQGIKQARGEYIWLLDVDTVINKAALSALFLFMHEHPHCGVCGCKLMNSEGEVQHSCRRYPWFRYKLYNVFCRILPNKGVLSAFWEKVNQLSRKQFYLAQMDGKVPFSVEYLIGACQFIRKEVFTAIGLLDEQIFYGPEDADFCLRANEAGWEVCYLPQVSFIHEYQRMTNKHLFSKMSWRHIKALFYFYRKHAHCKKQLKHPN